MKLLKSLKLLLGISAIKTSSFPNRLKLADIKLLHKKSGKTAKKAMDQSVFCQQYQKYLNEFSLSKRQIYLIILCQTSNVDLVHKIAS